MEKSRKTSHIHCLTIRKEVEEYFGLDKGLDIKSRKAELARAREMYYLLGRHFTNASLAYLAASLGRTHATVIHALRNTDWFFKTDSSYTTDYENLKYALSIKMASFGEADDNQRNNERLTYLKHRKSEINKEIRLLESFNS